LIKGGTKSAQRKKKRKLISPGIISDFRGGEFKGSQRGLHALRVGGETPDGGEKTR